MTSKSPLARCSECVLKEAPYFPAEMRPGATFAVVTDYPRDLRERRLLPKLSGVRFQEAAPEGARFNIHSAVACAPGNWDEQLLELKRINQNRAKAGEKPLPGPVECCRPRLLQEIGTRPVVTLGAVGFEGMTGRVVDVMDVRGGPTEVDGRKVLPTIHPWLAQKAPVWRKVLASDLKKAVRWFGGERDWSEPRMRMNPRVEELKAFLSAGGPFAVDIETTLEPVETARIKCLGIGTATDAVALTFPPSDEVREVLKAFLTDERVLKVGHNFVVFDGAVLKRVLGVTPKPVVDTLLLHLLVAPEEMHGLGYVASMFTDAPAWKEEHRAAGGRSEEELHSYCMVDCAVTARVLGPLAEVVEALALDDRARLYHEVQGVFRRMREVGVPVDGLEEEKARLLGEMKAHEKVILAQGVNPNSIPQLRKLLFETWELVPQKAFSLDGESLRLLRRQVDGDRAVVFDALLARNRCRVRWRDLSEVSGPRVRLDWSVRADAWVPGLDRVMKAPDGRVLVSGRLTQTKLKLVTAEAGLRWYREVFLNRLDPHIEAARVMMGDKVLELPFERRQKARRFAADLVNCALFGGSDEAVFEAVMSLENDDGTLRYPQMNLRSVALMRKKWLELVPELPGWWKGEDQRLDVEARAKDQLYSALVRVAREGLEPVALVGDRVVVETDDPEKGEWYLRESGLT